METKWKKLCDLLPQVSHTLEFVLRVSQTLIRCILHILSPCTMGEQLCSSQILGCKIIYCSLSIQAWLTVCFSTISLKLHWADNDIYHRMYYHLGFLWNWSKRDFAWNPHFSHKMKDFLFQERTFLVWEISRFTNGNCQAHLILMIHLIFYLLRASSLAGLKWHLYSTLEEVQPWNKVKMGFLLDNRFSFDKCLPK